MPRRKVPKNKRTWVTLTQDFVKEWPEVLEGVNYNTLPITYVKWIDIFLKSSVTLHYDVQKELKIKSAKKVSALITEALDKHYQSIKKVDIKFDVPRLKTDIETKTNKILKKSFT
tara:strand:- start:169 stop:513 length:345 start_codon:yes stop_codon:yes gene_type:complete